MSNKEFKPLQDIYNTSNQKKFYSSSKWKFLREIKKAYLCEECLKQCFEEYFNIINYILNNEYNVYNHIKNNKELSPEDKEVLELLNKEVLELLNNTVNDDESYEDINNNINVSVSINNSAIAAYVDGINSGLNFINKDIDYELLQDVIKDDIVKYININIE